MGIIGSSYVAEAAAINALMGFIVVIILVSLLGIAAQVLLGLATYNDAKARGNSDPAMWGLLVGILGWPAHSVDSPTGWRSPSVRSAMYKIRTAHRFKTLLPHSNHIAQSFC